MAFLLKQCFQGDALFAKNSMELPWSISTIILTTQEQNRSFMQKLKLIYEKFFEEDLK